MDKCLFTELKGTSGNNNLPWLGGLRMRLSSSLYYSTDIGSCTIAANDPLKVYDRVGEQYLPKGKVGLAVNHAYDIEGAGDFYLIVANTDAKIAFSIESTKRSPFDKSNISFDIKDYVEQVKNIASIEKISIWDADVVGDISELGEKVLSPILIRNSPTLYGSVENLVERYYKNGVRDLIIGIYVPGSAVTLHENLFDSYQDGISLTFAANGSSVTVSYATSGNTIAIFNGASWSYE